MQTRHRIPTIFSIYMVDVLCCALGCVVLLWQVNYQEAEEKTAAAASSLSDLAQANQIIANRDQTILALSGELEYLKTSLADSHKKYLQISVERDKTLQERDKVAQLALVDKQRLDRLLKEHDELKKNHAATEVLLARFKLDNKELQSKSKLTAEQLADKLKAHADLLEMIAKADARVILLEKDIDAKKLELLLARTKSDEQTVKLKDADKRVINLENLLADVRAEGKDTL